MDIPEPLSAHSAVATSSRTDGTGWGGSGDRAFPTRRHRLAARMRRRWPAALGVGAAVVFFADGRPEPLTAFAWILVAMAAAYPAIGLARRQLGSSRALGVQLGATVAFTAIAVAVMSLDDELGRYLLAAGWLAHGLWDVAHHRTGRVVPRQWAEWCGIVDILGAAAFVLLPAPA